MTGQILQGRYKIIQNWKKGAFGKTYLAEDRQQPPEKRLCVVKHLQPGIANGLILQEARQRFEREIEVLGKIDAHPSIPKVTAYFEEDRQFYLVEEFIEGKDLSQEMSRGNRWSQGWVISLLHDVLDVLTFVHEHQVIHRNIKPSNLIRRASDNKIVVIDFGSVKEIETLAINPQGQIGTATIGTPGYIPIEQLGGKPRFNSDIYGLGMTAIQALTGIPPRQLERDAKTGQVIWHHLASVEPKLAQIIDKMVRSDYQERYQEPTEVLDDLRSLHNIGQTLDGRYHIISLLGEGAFGKTFLGADLQRSEKPRCVIKQFKPLRNDVFPWWEAKSFFDTEAQILHRLGTHDRIPNLLADFEQEREFYLVHEFVEGEPLSQEIHGGKKYTQAEAIALLQDVLETLSFVHDHHVIHSDLKPSNLIRRKSDGKIAIADFGSIKQVSTLLVERGQLTTSGPIGTPGYMPKEQLVGNPRPNSDIYALGAIALQALTGIHPERLGTDPHTGEVNWRNHVEVSEEFSAILDKMVRSYFRERYESAQEVLTDLQNLETPLKDKPHPLPAVAIAPTAVAEKSPTVPPTAAAEKSPTVPPTAVEPPVSAPAPKKVKKLPQGIRVKDSAVAPGEASNPSVKGKNLSEKLRSIKTWHLLVLVAIAGVFLWIGKIQENRSKIQQADVYVDRASQLLASQNFERAQDACDRAIVVKPDYSMAWKCRGDVLYMLERYESALVAYENASNLEPKNPKYWNNRGESLYQLERYQDAVADHTRALELRSNDVNARKGRGMALMALQRYDDALVEFEKALQIEPNDPQISENQGLVLEYLDRSQQAGQAFEQALAAYDRILEKNSGDVSAWVARGRVLSQLDRPEEALASFEKALEINPDYYLAWNAIGTTLYGVQRFYDALDAYDRALDIKPDFYKGWHNRGSLLSGGLARYEEAIASYDRAIELAPSFYHAWRDRGIAQSQLRRYEEAVESFDKALNIEPKDNKAWASRGVALNELRRYEEAVESFDKALAIQPNDAFAWTQRGIALESRELYEEALESYNKALVIQPDLQLALDSRRWVLDRLNR